jgi:hypothetical protein
MEARYSHPTHDGPFPVLGKAFLCFLEALMKIRLAMYEALKAIDVPEPEIESVIQAMETALSPSLAIKSDSDMAQFRAALSQLEVSLTVNVGVMLFLAVAILFAAVALIR